MCTNETQHWMEFANDLFTVCCGVSSVFLNILVLYIALRYVDFHVKLNQIYVVNMTASDLVYGLVFMSTKPWIGCFPGWLCACYYILVWCSQIGSVFFLLFLNIDKFISLSAPLHYHMYVTERRVRCLWMSFWVIPLSHSIFTYFGPWITPLDEAVPCRIGMHPIYYASTIIVFYIVPLTISAMISVYIYVLAHKKTQWTTPATDSQAAERKRASKQLLKRVFFVFSSTLWSTVSILPYRLAYCIFTFACVGVGSQQPEGEPLANVSTTIEYLSTFSPFEKSSTAALAFDTSTLIPSSSSLLSAMTTLGATMINGAADNTVGSVGGKPSPSMCESDEIKVLIYVLFCLPPLGAVGNPIITIVTQRFYRSRAARIWTSCMKAIHAPAILMCKCCCKKTIVDEETTYMSEGTMGSVVRRTVTSANDPGSGVPLLVSCRPGARGHETVAEPLCSNRAFQVL